MCLISWQKGRKKETHINSSLVYWFFPALKMYDVELPPFISIVRHPGRPAMLGTEKRHNMKSPGHRPADSCLSCRAVCPRDTRPVAHGFFLRSCALSFPEKPCPSIPWFLGFPWLILSKEFPWLFWYFLSFPRILWVRQ